MKTLLLVLAIATSLAPALAQAARGDLDPSFGDHGRLGPMPEFAGAIWDVEALEGGGALIGGGDIDIQSHRNFDNPRSSYFVVKVSNFASLLAEDGAVDPGYYATDVEGIDIGAAAHQADGKFISAGSRVPEGRTSRITRSQLVVFRFASDGSLDTGFGANGIFEWSGGENSYGHQASSIALEPDGRIVVAGTRGIAVGDTGERNLLILRLLADGSLDAAFGTGGVYIGPVADFSGEIRLAHNGAGGYRVPVYGAEGCVIVGLAMDGVPDAAFGSAGIATVESPSGDPVACNSLESLADGNLLVAGSAGENGFVARLLANGAPDPTFAADAAIANSMAEVSSIAAAAEGKVLVAGSGLEGSSIVRLRESGELDSLFGDGGRTWIDLDSELGSTPIVHDMAVREDGGVIAGGGDTWTDQSFVVRLLGEDGAASPGVVSFTEDNYADPQESGGQAVVHVRRTGGSDGDVSVTYRTIADEEATADQDFTATSGSLQWADGDSSDKEIVVGIAQDGGTPEVFESFHVALADVQGGAGLGTRTATVTIQPDGSPAGQIEIDDTDYGPAGENGIGQIALFRNYYSGGTVCVTVTPRSGTAIAGEDFSAEPSTYCWGDQDFDSKLAEIPFIDDNTQEGDESFFVELSNPTGGAIIGTRASAAITIAANDEPVDQSPPPPPPGGGGAAGVPELLLGLVWLFAQRRRLHYRWRT